RHLEPAPFERQPVRVVAVRGGEREVVVEALPVPACIAAAAATPNHAGELLEAPPVVPRVAAFHLMRARRRAPQQPGWKLDRGGPGDARLAGFARRRSAVRSRACSPAIRTR